MDLPRLDMFHFQYIIHNTFFSNHDFFLHSSQTEFLNRVYLFAIIKLYHVKIKNL